MTVPEDDISLSFYTLHLNEQPGYKTNPMKWHLPKKNSETPPSKLLKDLNEQADKFSVKVKVINKGHPMVSPNKTRYQRLRLQDKEGYKIGEVLSWRNIDHFDV